MGDDYPIIEEDTIIEWTGGDSDQPDLVRVEGMFADEDGIVQLRITETHPDSPESPRTITLDDLHDQLDWRDYYIDQA